MPQSFDVIVLGAGMVGVSVAVHLQQRGRAVALLDRKPAGSETWMGNAGLIQREGVFPYAFPRDLGTLLHYATNTAPELRYHLLDLPALAPFLLRYWRNSAPARHRRIAGHYATLIEHCVAEHRELAAQAGALHLLRPAGWMRVYRSQRRLHAALQEATDWQRDFGVACEAFDADALRPARAGRPSGRRGALPRRGPLHRPAGTGAGLRRVVRAPGRRPAAGRRRHAARGLERRVGTGHAERARGGRGARPVGAAGDGPGLREPVLDAEVGYLLAPMRRGIRLTTGVELARLDAPPTPVQLGQVEPRARELLALGARLDEQPWMGQRPCTPDMLPLLGPAPGQRGLWLAHGHAHHGFTLGPVSGRLLAEMICGQPTLLDPTPFAPARFA